MIDVLSSNVDISKFIKTSIKWRKRVEYSSPLFLAATGCCGGFLVGVQRAVQKLNEDRDSVKRIALAHHRLNDGLLRKESEGVGLNISKSNVLDKPRDEGATVLWENGDKEA